MKTTNQHRTWGRKPRSFGENSDNSSRGEDDAPDGGRSGHCTPEHVVHARRVINQFFVDDTQPPPCYISQEVD
ncbi:hypothetical protein TNCV_1178191 [Trichonephila clavipes]|nr:hypothetical protein TNCV_1178191 [Trichonephila clavipes]